MVLSRIHFKANVIFFQEELQKPSMEMEQSMDYMQIVLPQKHVLEHGAQKQKTTQTVTELKDCL